ncbi:hypothetical protein [Microvirga tunisiensis]|uniref:hypothetical protein n=1 Tax=Microvirga tunisiensis TaxID=2108360 RepID=UPI00128D69D0|nr:hypothetical protein [Microvirga tunisiensis]MPR06915.1 hypothetical protein [Microvirga tunisiensis]
MPVGRAGHVMTGPNYYGPGSPAGRDQSFGYEPFDPSITGNFGSNYGPSSFADSIYGSPQPISQAPMAQLKGFAGRNSFGTRGMRDPIGNFDYEGPMPPQRPGKVGMRNPNVGPIPPSRPLSGVGTMLKGNAGVNELSCSAGPCCRRTWPDPACNSLPCNRPRQWPARTSGRRGRLAALLDRMPRAGRPSARLTE